SEILTIDPDLAVAIHTIKLNKHQLSFGSHWDSERLPIPTHATGQCAATSPRRRVLTKLALDTPVVRQIELPPLRIVQSRVLRVRNLTKVKPPILSKQNSFSRTRIRKRD